MGRLLYLTGESCLPGVERESRCLRGREQVGYTQYCKSKTLVNSLRALLCACVCVHACVHLQENCDVVYFLFSKLRVNLKTEGNINKCKARNQQLLKSFCNKSGDKCQHVQWLNTFNAFIHFLFYLWEVMAVKYLQYLKLVVIQT